MPSRLAPVLLACLLLGCHSTIARQPPGAPPTAQSVTRDEPGGDADDPHHAALERLLAEGWGWRNDRQDALHVPLPDWEHWRRVKFWGVTTFVGFRYGDSHHAVAAVWVRRPDDGKTDEPASCLEQFESWGESSARKWGASFDRGELQRRKGPGGDVVVRAVDASVDSLFSHKRYAGAYAAYHLWPGTCTILGFAVPTGDDDELARKVRDRYVAEGFPALDRRRDTAPEF